jgi:hypothetical protein
MCYGLTMRCSPQAHVLNSGIPSWWSYWEVVETSGGWVYLDIVGHRGML